MVRLTVSWLYLVVLTLLSVALVGSGWPADKVLMLALLMVVMKNQVIVDVFMGLKGGPALWRGLLGGYTLVIAVFVVALNLL